jgi:hypothetical protein
MKSVEGKDSMRPETKASIDRKGAGHRFLSRASNISGVDAYLSSDLTWT